MPEEARNEEWEDLIKTTIERRSNLKEMAWDMYTYKSKIVDVVGTEERDLFELIGYEDSVKVIVTSISKRERGSEFYIPEPLVTELQRRYNYTV